MYSNLKSFGLLGIDSYLVNVETDISNGMPSFEIVGLPDMAVKESRDRVRAAIKNCDYTFPVGRITVNLAPADTKKMGPVYDLAIMLGILIASRQIENKFEDTAFVGELSLNGEIRAVNGVLSMAIKAKEAGLKSIIVPFDNRFEAGVVDGIEVLPAKTVYEVIEHFFGEQRIEGYKSDLALEQNTNADMLDFIDVKGHQMVKRAVEIAAAGGHNILFIGPAGSGKSMIAKRIPSILPQMTFDEAITTTKIHSVSGTLKSGVSLIRQRPFRAPHHSVSPHGLAGGGAFPKPGEISLAHNGVLFLDELPEFKRDAMEALRQPLEDGTVTVTRASGTVTYPSNIILIAAMNPCPCGYYGHPTKPCTCSQNAVHKYLNKISGPLLDRLDLHIEVPPVDYKSLSEKTVSETSAQIRERVNRARASQVERYKGTGITCNAQLTPSLLRKHCVMTAQASEYLSRSFDAIGLSARAYDRILKVARTVADLKGNIEIQKEDIGTALRFRSLDRKYWE